jgi:hypothetical protein
MAVKLTGHKTRDIFDRRESVSERDLAGGAARLATSTPSWRSAARGRHDTGVQSELQLDSRRWRDPMGAALSWWMDWSSKPAGVRMDLGRFDSYTLPPQRFAQQAPRSCGAC